MANDSSVRCARGARSASGGESQTRESDLRDGRVTVRSQHIYDTHTIRSEDVAPRPVVAVRGSTTKKGQIENGPKAYARAPRWRGAHPNKERSPIHPPRTTALRTAPSFGSRSAPSTVDCTAQCIASICLAYLARRASGAPQFSSPVALSLSRLMPVSFHQRTQRSGRAAPSDD